MAEAPRLARIAHVRPWGGAPVDIEIDGDRISAIVPHGAARRGARGRRRAKSLVRAA